MEGGDLARMRGGRDRSRGLEEVLTINKCRGPPNSLCTVNESSNQNSAYIQKPHLNIENSHDIEKPMSQQRVQIEFVEEIG